MTDRRDDPPLRGRDLHHEEGRGDALSGGTRSEADLRSEDRTDELEDFNHDDFMKELSLEEISTITGLPRPIDPTPEEEEEFRELAWENVKLDVAAREEWGGVLPDRDPGEDPGTEEERK